MSSECATVVSGFTEALLAADLGSLTSATKMAYACGADLRELLVLVEGAHAQGEVSPLIAEHARSVVCGWQWIADRRRALA